MYEAVVEVGNFAKNLTASRVNLWSETVSRTRKLFDLGFVDSERVYHDHFRHVNCHT